MTAFTVDPKSVIAITKEADQVMVYGWGHCNYSEVSQAIRAMSREDDFPIKAVYGNQMGYPTPYEVEGSMTLEGRKMNQIFFDISDSDYQMTARICKTALVNLVLENYKRIKEGKSVIPTLFCIDIDDNPKPFSSERICSKERGMNIQITHKELRRACKLCNHPNAAIREAALSTFKFVKLVDKEGSYALKEIAAPWEDESWKEAWGKRKLQSSSVAKNDEFSWRKQLVDLVAAYDASRAPAPSLSLDSSLDAKKDNTPLSPATIDLGEPQEHGLPA
jgi:hypothetical protein